MLELFHKTVAGVYVALGAFVGAGTGASVGVTVRAEARNDMTRASRRGMRPNMLAARRVAIAGVLHAPRGALVASFWLWVADVTAMTADFITIGHHPSRISARLTGL